MLQKKGIKNANGQYREIKPEYNSGFKDAISLGTNVCCRGTDI